MAIVFHKSDIPAGRGILSHLKVIMSDEEIIVADIIVAMKNHFGVFSDDDGGSGGDKVLA